VNNTAIEQNVEVVFVDQDYTGDSAGHALDRSQASRSEKDFVLLPRRWVSERSFGWMNRFRGLAWDYERLPKRLKNLLLGFCCSNACQVRSFHGFRLIVHRPKGVLAPHHPG
jgi:hypothetical protein